MNGRNLIKTGALGATTMGLCCFTPLLVIGLGAVGLSAWLAWLDYVLLPGLAASLIVLGYGIWRLKSS